MIDFFTRSLGRAIGLSAFLVASSVIVLWVGVLTAAGILATYDTGTGLDRVFCLAGVQISDAPCRQTNRVLTEARQARAEAERQRAALREQIARIETLEENTDRYTLFTTETPPDLAGVDVTTGWVYATLLERGDPESQYCYAIRTSGDGVSIRVSLTDNDDGRLVWTELTDVMAAGLGLRLAQLEAARDACRFVGRGPSR